MNIGIIGTGMIVEQFIQAAKSIEGVIVSSLYSRNKESVRAEELTTKYGIASTYDNLDEMLSNSGVDFIYVASPNSLHYSQSLKALESGKNVICEKPYTSTGKEARHLLDTAREKGLMIFEAIVTIHLPNYKAVKDNLHRLGPIHIVQLNYSQYSSRYDSLLSGQLPNVFNPEFAGGSLQDINIYNVHFMTGMFGIPEKYEYFPNIHENGIDTSGIMIMQYPGFTATLTGSKDTRGRNFVYIQGEKGFIHVKNGSNGCQEVEIDIAGSEPRTLNIQYDPNRLVYELEAFRDMYKSKNYERCYELAGYSANVAEMVESARKKNGIIFPADS